MLATNVYCRPFDDRTESAVNIEAEFSEKILELAEHKKIEILSSDILYAELGLIDDKRKRDIILSEIKSVAQKNIAINKQIYDLSDGLINLISDYSDCLHIASAAFAGCDCLITCDKELTQAKPKIESFLMSKGFSLNILTPREFVSSIGD